MQNSPSLHSLWSRVVAPCDNTPGRPTPTISASLNQTAHGQWFICFCFFFISTQGHYIFLYGHTEHNREGGSKEQMNKHGLGISSKCKKWEALRAFAGYRGRIIARNFHKATRNAESSFDFHFCPATIFLLSASADCVFLWTVISSRLFSSALLCQLTLFVFSGNFLLPSTSGLVLRPFVWVSRQNRNEFNPSCHNLMGPIYGLDITKLRTYAKLNCLN